MAPSYLLEVIGRIADHAKSYGMVLSNATPMISLSHVQDNATIGDGSREAN